MSPSPPPNFPKFSEQISEAPGNVLPLVKPQVIEIVGIPYWDDLEDQLAKAFLADHDRDPYHPYNLAKLQRMLKNWKWNWWKIIKFAIPK